MAKLDIAKYMSRKVLHISCIWIPIIYLLTDYMIALLAISGTTVVVLIIDLLRILPNPLKPKVHKLFKYFGLQDLLKPKEMKRLSGASYMMLGASLGIFLFPEPIFITSYLILCISDPFAAYIGKKYGKGKIHGKSYEGSVAFFLSACVISLPIIIWLDHQFILIVCIITTTIAELYSEKIKIDDNVLIPLVFGITWELLK
ncbi:MAG: diacylglycerol/polyprenol kinase family protein, partial [Alphaproteobacteria bacterium]|jgi:dolichol kinase